MEMDFTNAESKILNLICHNGGGIGFIDLYTVNLLPWKYKNPIGINDITDLQNESSLIWPLKYDIFEMKQDIS